MYSRICSLCECEQLNDASSGALSLSPFFSFSLSPRWIDENRSALESMGSSLPFCLHRLAFLTLLDQGATMEAVA